jgi:hypothetical protein
MDKVTGTNVNCRLERGMGLVDLSPRLPSPHSVYRPASGYHRLSASILTALPSLPKDVTAPFSQVFGIELRLLIGNFGAPSCVTRRSNALPCTWRARGRAYRCVVCGVEPTTARFVCPIKWTTLGAEAYIPAADNGPMARVRTRVADVRVETLRESLR